MFFFFSAAYVEKKYTIKTRFSKLIFEYLLWHETE